MENIVVVHSVMSDCDPMDCSMQGFPALNYLQEFVQAQVHWVSDVIQPPHLLSPLSPVTWSFPMIGLLASGAQIIGASTSASVLPMHIQGWFPLGLTGWISLLSKGLSRVFSNITIQKHQLFCAQPLYGPTLASIYDYWKKHSFDYTDLSWHLQNDFTCLRLRLAK